MPFNSLPGHRPEETDHLSRGRGLAISGNSDTTTHQRYAQLLLPPCSHNGLDNLQNITCFLTEPHGGAVYKEIHELLHFLLC